MKEVRYFFVPDAGNVDTLPDDEAQHAVKVLRLTIGDIIYLMDGNGNFYEAEVTLASNHHCKYRILKVLPQERTWNGTLTIAIAPTKMLERMEWFVEKAVEIGVDRIVFLDCKFSERKVIKLPRLEKICISAVKQSRKAWMPKLDDMIPIKDFLQQPIEGKKFIAHCYDEFDKKDFFDSIKEFQVSDSKFHGSSITIMIGPEGDFSVDEVQFAIDHGWGSVTLGKSRLRTETAGIVAASMMNLARRKQ